MIICQTTSTLLTFIFALLAIAFYTLLERNILGYFQTRNGPNNVSLIGIPQPLADAANLIINEHPIPTNSNPTIFIASPLIALSLALLLWSLYPSNFQSITFPISILFFLCISSFNVYSILMAGWSSNSNYSLLGALRSVAQTISYEISIALILLSVITYSHSLSLENIYSSTTSLTILAIAPIACLWFLTSLAETSRTPFDLAEGESELVSGFNIEYGSTTFALIFIAEYINIIVISLITVSLFIPSPPLATPIITFSLSALFVWIRASIPRIRYDNLIHLTWKGFLPLSIAILMIILPTATIMALFF